AGGRWTIIIGINCSVVILGRCTGRRVACFTSNCSQHSPQANDHRIFFRSWLAKTFGDANFSARCLMRGMRGLRLFFVALFCIMFCGIAAEKPFNFQHTPGKLPKEVVPTEYSVRIVPDIDKLIFAGTETVKLNVRSPVHQLVLNALELKIEAASLDGEELPDSAIKVDDENQLLTLALPSELATGDHTLALRFAG